MRKNKINYKKCIVIFKIIFVLSFFFLHRMNNNNYLEMKKYFSIKNSKAFNELFFVIDSNDLESVQSHMYGFFVSKKGIITDNYYKNLGYYEDPEPTGAYIMIRKKEDEIILNQDYSGS